MLGLVESSNLAQARALGFEALLDFGIIFDVDEIRRHSFLRLWAIACSSFQMW
jgi:hypothetical protein